MRSAVPVVAIIATVVALAVAIHAAPREPRAVQTTVVPAPGVQRTIWILWMQGWNDETPWLVWEVRRSWEEFNRGWRVVALDASTLGAYVDMSPGSASAALGRMAEPGSGVPLAAYSDLVRLALLSTHGGVWADATMLCMSPLDEWVYDALLPCGVWMYHGRDHGYGPARRLIVGIRHSRILREWARACFEYWRLRGYGGAPHDYFWMDALFADLRRTDAEFERQWSLVPYLWCEAFGQAHMLSGKHDWPCSQETRELLEHSPPHAIKLSRHARSATEGPRGFERTGTYQAALASRRRRSRLPSVSSEAALSHTRHVMVGTVSARELPELPDRIAVLADCGCEESVRIGVGLCRAHGVMPLVYDKCGFCAAVPDGVFCRPLRNVGRDLGTFMWFVSRYYHVIPDSTVVYLTAGNMKKHDRAARLDALLGNKPREATVLGHAERFTLREYEGATMRPTGEADFRRWYERYVGPWEPGRPGACWNALVRTTGRQIRKRPRSTYVNVYNELALADGIEAGHFVERCVHALLGS